MRVRNEVTAHSKRRPELCAFNFPMPCDAPNDRAIDSASSHDNCCDLSALLATPAASMDRVFVSMSSRWNNARACERFRVMRRPRCSYLRAPTPTRSAGRQPGRPEAGKHSQPDDTHASSLR